MRPQFFLPDIVRPTATRLTDTAAHHQEIDDAAVVHIHVVPVIQTGAQNDHGLSVSLFGVVRKGPRGGNDLIARDTRDLLRPSRRVRHVVVEIAGDMRTTEAAVEAVIGDQQVEHRCNEYFAVFGVDSFGRQTPNQYVRMIRAREIVVLAIAKIRESDVEHFVVPLFKKETHFQVGFCAGTVARFEVPLPLLAPTEADAAARAHQRLRLTIKGDRLPFRVVALAHIIGKV